MRVLPDTPIWSAALRRGAGIETEHCKRMRRLVTQGVVEIIGPIRQELLSGVREPAQFEKLKDRLRTFLDLRIETEDYAEAATYYNRCRAKGIQGSGTDFLICAMAIRHDLAIFTDDRDFLIYQKVLPIRLYPAEAGG